MADWYYEFLADPVEFILEHGSGTKKITILAGNSEKKEDYPPFGDSPPDNLRNMENGLNEKLEDNENLSSVSNKNCKSLKIVNHCIATA